TLKSDDVTFLNLISDFPFYRTLEMSEDYLYSKMLVRYNDCASEVSVGISCIDDDSVSKVFNCFVNFSAKVVSVVSSVAIRIMINPTFVDRVPQLVITNSPTVFVSIGVSRYTPSLVLSIELYNI